MSAADAPGGGSAPMSFAAMATTERTESVGKLQNVQVNGLVLLRIARHCRESEKEEPVFGQLLGLDVESTLEVSGCFPFPSASSRSGASGENAEAAGADMEDEVDEHNLEMLRCLREIGVDSNIVGWYQTAVRNLSHARLLVMTFLNYYETMKRCVCIIYDTSCTTKGNSGFKAVSLSEKFLELYKNGSVTVEGYVKIIFNYLLLTQKKIIRLKNKFSISMNE